jgi:hypothetical protein
MHWNRWPSGTTACGKNATRCRATANLVYWEDQRMADGRRCPACKRWVEKMQKEDRAALESA